MTRTPGKGNRERGTPAPASRGRSDGSGELDLDLRCAVETDVTVLITGRQRLTTQVARWIHRNGPRRKGPLVVVDCTRATCPPAIVPGLQLAGDAATPDASGSLDGAVLLLQEVGAMAPDALAQLLRDVKATRLETTPGPGPRSRGVRIIATSSKDLAADVAKGTFPAECFYCLNAIHLVVSKDALS